MARTDAAERLATNVFRRVLESPALLGLFTDEASIAAFWHLPDDQRRNQWGAPLNIPISPQPFAIAMACPGELAARLCSGGVLPSLRSLAHQSGYARFARLTQLVKEFEMPEVGSEHRTRSRKRLLTG